MDRTHVALAEASLKELRKGLKVAKERKNYFENYFHEIEGEFQAGKISRDFYIETIHKHYDGRTLKEWISFYEHYINECRALIAKKRKEFAKKQIGIFLFSFIFILFLLSFIFTDPQFVGFIIEEPTQINPNEINATVSLTQSDAIIGQPVKWRHHLNLDVSLDREIMINLPSEAENINIKQIKSYSEEELLQNQTSPIHEEVLRSGKFRITGNVIYEQTEPSYLAEFFQNIGKLTGRVVDETKEIEQEIKLEESGEYEIEYETPAPYAVEQKITKGKQVKIIGPETVHYEDVLAFTNLDENLNIKNPSQVKIYWVENNTYLSPTKVEDTNNNGIYDYIEWVVPHLSTQTFNIIVITKAEHLDENRNFISDIYEQVKELDNVWSEPIPSNDFVRVVFEIPLTSDRDITIYPRIVSGTPRIEVYGVDGTEIIAEFTSLTSNEYNKVYLTNLQGSQDTFDLRILDGSIEIDHIIDPTSYYNFTVYNSNRAYGQSSDTGTVTSAYSGQNALPTTFASAWGANSQNFTTAGYTAVSAIDGSYANITSDGNNEEPLGVFNFTIAEPFADILWVNVTMVQSQKPVTDTSCNYYIANYTSGVFEEFGTGVTGETMTMRSYNYSNLALSNILNGTNTISIMSEAQADSGEGCNVDYVGVIVGYQEPPPDNPPQWQNPSVNNSNPLPSATVRHNINWTDDNALSFARLEVNSSGASCDTTDNVSSTTLSGASQWANLSWQVPNACEGKTIEWKQYANDSANQWNSSMPLQTYTVQNIAPTAAFGTNPINNYNSSISSVNFELKVSDNLGVSYLLLYGNWSGSWIANQTNSSPINDTVWSIQVTGIPEGTHKWAVWGNDTLGNEDWTDTNRTFTVDKTPPTITLPVYANATQKKSSEDLTLNISVDDGSGVGVDSCVVNVATATASNQTIAYINGWCNGTYNLAGISEGNQTINVYANDTVNNWGLNNSYVVWIDTTPPTITLPVYTNLTAKKSSDNLFINASVTDTGVGASYCAINVATATASNVTIAVSNGWCNTSYSLSGTSEGNQIINVYANDTLDNLGLNNSYVVMIDDTPPTITLPVYTNATSKINTATLTLNVSVSDSLSGLTGSMCKIEVNGTNTTIAVSNGWCNSTTIPLTNLADGNRTINVYVNDSVNNLGLNNSYVVQIISNVAPTIPWIESISPTNPTDDTTTSIVFNFTARDENGYSDINVSSVNSSFMRAGEEIRTNTSCVNWSQSGNDMNFSCTIDMWYFDENGAWTINVSIEDDEGEYAENSSTTFIYNVLPAMKMSPISLNWPEINLLNTDIGSLDNPIQINNTGNKEPLNINVTAYDLQGEEQTSYYIYAVNFTVGNTSEGCSGTAMSNATSLNITSAILYRGNNSLNYNNATSGQEQLYFCLKGVPQNNPAQSYSSSAYGAWEIRILLVALIPARRRKKKKNNQKEKEKSENKELSKEKTKDEKLLESLDLLEYLHIVDKLKEQYHFSKEEIIRTLAEKISKKYKVEREGFLRIMKAREEISIPITIFSKELGALESLVKYMKENLNMSYREISKELQRDERTIWTAYKKATEKQKKPFEARKEGIRIPLSVFENKKLTILESVILYLKNKGFRFSEIAEMLERDQRNIWTIYSKAKSKIINKA